MEDGKIRTYQSLNKNEVRAVELTIKDIDGQSFTVDSAYAEVLNSSGSAVVDEQAAYTQVGKIYTIIGTTVTATTGTYKIIWRIVKDSYTYYHATELSVVEP